MMADCFAVIQEQDLGYFGMFVGFTCLIISMWIMFQEYVAKDTCRENVANTLLTWHGFLITDP